MTIPIAIRATNIKAQIKAPVETSVVNLVRRAVNSLRNPLVISFMLWARLPVFSPTVNMSTASSGMN